MNKQLTLNIRLRDDATFGNFVGSAADRIQHGSGLVFVFGASGTGKSHLLQALCHSVNQDGGTSIYLQDPGSHAPDILGSLDSFSVVCLDDIETSIGNEAWEVELFHLINSIVDGGSRLVISSSLPASSLEIKLPDLASRLRAAVAVEIDPLTDLEKLEVLKIKANNRGFTLNDEVARFILGRASRDMNHLVDLLSKLEAETLRLQKKLTIPFVKQTLQL
jgi:DnaA family protein